MSQMKQDESKKECVCCMRKKGADSRTYEQYEWEKLDVLENLQLKKEREKWKEKLVEADRKWTGEQKKQSIKENNGKSRTTNRKRVQTAGNKRASGTGKRYGRGARRRRNRRIQKFLVLLLLSISMGVCVGVLKRRAENAKESEEETKKTQDMQNSDEQSRKGEEKDSQKETQESEAEERESQRQGGGETEEEQLGHITYPSIIDQEAPLEGEGQTSAWELMDP